MRVYYFLHPVLAAGRQKLNTQLKTFFKIFRCPSSLKNAYEQGSRKAATANTDYPHIAPDAVRYKKNILYISYKILI